MDRNENEAAEIGADLQRFGASLKRELRNLPWPARRVVLTDLVAQTIGQLWQRLLQTDCTPEQAYELIGELNANTLDAMRVRPDIVETIRTQGIDLSRPPVRGLDLNEDGETGVES